MYQKFRMEAMHKVLAPYNTAFDSQKMKKVLANENSLNNLKRNCIYK